MNERKLILAWSFGLQEYADWPMISFEGEKLHHKEIKIQDNDEDSLDAVVLPNRETNRDEILKIVKFIANKAKDFSGTHMILLHETNFDQGNIQSFLKDEIGKCLNGCTYEFFGGGKAEKHKTIYEKLLGDSDVFLQDAFHRRYDVIKKDVFNAIWDEYVKKKIVRLKYDILSDFCPIVIDMRGLKESAKRKRDAKSDGYFKEIKDNKNWVPLSEDCLSKKGDWPSKGLRKEIETAIKQIAFLGEIIEKSEVSQDVIEEMKNKQFNIDEWYSGLEESFERYT